MFSIYSIPFVFVGLIILVSAFFIVKQQTAVIIERFGKFQSTSFWFTNKNSVSR